jgi:pheromone shutdown protein TraB
MVTRLRHINPIQFALVSATLYAILGFIIALLWLPFASLVAASAASTSGARWFGAGVGIMALVLWPLLYFIGAFIFGLITAFLYNIVAKWTGGIEVTLEQHAEAGLPAGAATI